MTTSKYGVPSDARAQQEGNYARPGHYLALVNSVRQNKNRSNVERVVVEMTTLHTFADSQTGTDYSRKAQIPTLSPGEDWAEIMLRSNEAYFPRFLNLMQTLRQKPRDQLTDADYDEVLLDSQAGAGLVVELKVEQKINKKAENKPTEQLSTKDDTYCKVLFRRVLPFSEVKQVVDAAIAARFIPDLDDLVKSEG